MNPHADSVQQPSYEQALLGWTRYEKARKLNVAQWAELHQRNLRGENFDDMIDALPATTQPVRQDIATWLLARKYKPSKFGSYVCRWHAHKEEIQLLWDGRQWIGPAWDGTMRAPTTFGMGDAGAGDEWWSGATPPAEKQAAPAADQQPSNLEDFREAVRDMEAAALKVENDWRSTDAAVLEAQEKQERAKQLLARIDGARQLPNWRGAKQAAPSGETARFRRALTDIKYKAVSLADAQVIALRALNGFDSDYPRATPAPQDTKRADNHG